MKKRYIVFFFVLSFVLGGCGQGESLDTKDVLAKASEAAESVNGYTINMVMKIDMLEMDNTITATGDVTHDPITMHLNMNMGMPGMSMDFELYGTEQEAYMNMFGDWIKMSSNEMGLNDFDQLTSEQIEKFEEFSDQFEMSEEEDYYFVTLSGDGDELEPLIESILSSSLGVTGEQDIQQLKESIQINHLDIEMNIDKENFVPINQMIKADLIIEEENTTTPVQLESQFDISNINEIHPIDIPQEIKDNAVEEEEFMGF